MTKEFEEQWYDFVKTRSLGTREEIENSSLLLALIANSFSEEIFVYMKVDFGRIDTTKIYAIIKKKLFKSNSFLKDLKEYYEKSEKTIFVEKRFIGLLVEFLNQISFPIQEWFKIYEYCKIHNLEKEAFEILGGLKK